MKTPQVLRLNKVFIVTEKVPGQVESSAQIGCKLKNTDPQNFHCFKGP